MRFGPPVGPRWHLATQAAAAMAVPVVVLSLLGLEQLGLLAATGAFAVLYGGRLTPRERSRVVPLIAIALFVSAGIAVLGVSASRRVALTRGIHRALGSAAGGGLYLLIALVPLPGVVLGLVLGGLQFVIELVIVRHYALALMFITPLVLLILGSAGAGGVDVAVERVVDTVPGSALGVLSGLIVVRGRRL